jgi:hypothetical protein
MAATICWAGRARIASSALLDNTASSQATRTSSVVPATIWFGPARVPNNVVGGEGNDLPSDDDVREFSQDRFSGGPGDAVIAVLHYRRRGT